MKNVLLLSASMLFGIFILVSFSGKKKTTAFVTPSASSIISCLPIAPTLITAATFKAKYEPTAGLMIRKNVDALSTDEINALKVGIIKMKALPYTNPTSWWYQAAIHGTTMTDNLPSWNSCHKTGQSFFFFAWHRMYVYFFERILRDKSGRANLTVPYWNYQINPVMHPAFRDKSLGNPLYDGTRNATINNGGALPASIMTAFSNSLEITSFYTFQSNLNSGPHGAVHGAINGNMAVVPTAAQDPIFWLHHSNIDRLWEEWLSKCGGRTNPVDASFLNNTYTFFDETGTAVSMKGSQVLQISTQLNYKYDATPSDVTCTSSSTLLLASSQTLLTTTTSVQLNGQTSMSSFVQQQSTPLDTFIKVNKRTNFRFNNTTAPERLALIFEGVKIAQMPQGIVEVYLNLPAGTTPVANSKYFVGLLDLFSAEHHAAHAGMAGNQEIEMDATKAAQTQGLKLADLKKAEVSFVVRGCTLNGKEVKTQAQITIQRIKFSLDKFKK